MALASLRFYHSGSYLDGFPALQMQLILPRLWPGLKRINLLQSARFSHHLATANEIRGLVARFLGSKWNRLRRTRSWNRTHGGLERAGSGQDRSRIRSG